MTSSMQTLRASLRDSARLRWGIWTILGIGWLHALLLWDDSIVRVRGEVSQLHEQADRLRPFERGEALWQERAAEARMLYAGLQGLQWEARSLSRAEAAFRDWLQARAKEVGLGVRELSAGVQTPTDPASGTPPSAVTAAPVVVRARLAATYRSAEAAALLLSFQANARKVTVRRLLIRNPAPPQEAQIEVELQALFALKETPQ